MKLFEHQGKEMFLKYGISIPKNELIFPNSSFPNINFPFVLKAQVLSGNRKQAGGIVFVKRTEEFEETKNSLFKIKINGLSPESLLAEAKIDYTKEIYVSFSYDTHSRAPVLALSKDGGTGIDQADIFPIDVTLGVTDFFIEEALKKSHFEKNEKLVQTILTLWNLFAKEKALLAEINPLFETKDGNFIAGDAKVILDDSVVDPKSRPFLHLGGDIAVIASGGGASLLNLDALIKNGGRPANYVEYSGNPTAESVKILTKQVLSKPGLKGLWVVGGTANFTDIYETMLGFFAGLKETQPKPEYPIVIRRDGPRQKEAFEMLKREGALFEFDFHLFGPETSMTESAKTIVELSYKK